MLQVLTRTVLTFEATIISTLGSMSQNDWAFCTLEKIHVAEEYVCGTIVGISKLSLAEDAEKTFQTICVFTGWVHLPPKEIDGYKLVMVNPTYMNQY